MESPTLDLGTGRINKSTTDPVAQAIAHTMTKETPVGMLEGVVVVAVGCLEAVEDVMDVTLIVVVAVVMTIMRIEEVRVVVHGAVRISTTTVKVNRTDQNSEVAGRQSNPRRRVIRRPHTFLDKRRTCYANLKDAEVLPAARLFSCFVPGHKFH